MAITEGARHIGLTVPDDEVARDFSLDQLGFDEVGGKPHYPGIFVSDRSPIVTLWSANVLRLQCHLTARPTLAWISWHRKGAR